MGCGRPQRNLPCWDKVNVVVVGVVGVCSYPRLGEPWKEHSLNSGSDGKDVSLCCPHRNKQGGPRSKSVPKVPRSHPIEKHLGFGWVGSQVEQVTNIRELAALGVCLFLAYEGSR